MWPPVGRAHSSMSATAKLTLSIRVDPPHPGWATSPSGLSCGLEVSRGGELDTGALKVPGLGRPPRPSRQEGALSPREGESLA